MCVKWDERGLVVPIAQNVDTGAGAGAILMQGFANMDALGTTISSRKAAFNGRSRSTLWTRGESFKNFINVHDIFLDCDCDSVCLSQLLIEIIKFSSTFCILIENFSLR